MKERPINLSEKMVQALLEGRKTQDRRIITKQPPSGYEFAHWIVESSCRAEEGKAVWISRPEGGRHSIRCPFGRPGDRLWVRETFGSKIVSVGGTPHESVAYKATEPDAAYCTDCNGRALPVKWKKSILMPRKHARIMLEITRVGVGRLQDISESDAECEGVAPAFTHPGIDWVASQPKYKWGFHKHWARHWDANPWVWIIEFKRVAGEVAI